MVNYYYCLVHTIHLIFFQDFIFFTHERHREAETQAEGEAGSMQEPDAGLDPRTPGSRPEPRADTPPLSHPGAPGLLF